MLLYAYCRQEGEDVNDVILQQTHLTTMLCFLDSKGIERTLRSFTTAASYSTPEGLSRENGSCEQNLPL
jgi:hypothetical protein